MKKLRRILVYCFYLLLTALVVTFSVSNREYVQLSIFPLPYTIDIPLFFFGLMSFCTGLLTAGFLFSFKNVRTRHQLKKESRHKQALEVEVATLRAESLSLTHVQELSKKAS